MVASGAGGKSYGFFIVQRIDRLSLLSWRFDLTQGIFADDLLPFGVVEYQPQRRVEMADRLCRERLSPCAPVFRAEIGQIPLNVYRCDFLHGASFEILSQPFGVVPIERDGDWFIAPILNPQRQPNLIDEIRKAAAMHGRGDFRLGRVD